MVEVLISGGGPAGTAAAIVLARRGVRVLLVDHSRVPRDPSGGVALSPRAMTEVASLGLSEPIAARGLALTAMRIACPSAEVAADYPGGGVGRALRRAALDAVLLEAASQAGAQVREGVAVPEALVDAGMVRGAVLLVDGRRVRVPAAVTIEADGREATLARSLGLVRSSPYQRTAVAASFAGVAGLSARVELHLRRGHGLVLTPMPDGGADLYLLATARDGATRERASLDDAIRRDARLAERFAGARLAGPPATRGPLIVDVPVAGVEGLLLAGDAAGTRGPLGGDGVRLAIRGGVLAAEMALTVLEHRVRGAHEELTRRRREAFGARWRAARRWRSVAGCPRGARLVCALARHVPAVARTLVAVAGDAGPAATQVRGTPALPAAVPWDEDRASRGRSLPAPGPRRDR